MIYKVLRRFNCVKYNDCYPKGVETTLDTGDTIEGNKIEVTDWKGEVIPDVIDIVNNRYKLGGVLTEAIKELK